MEVYFTRKLQAKYIPASTDWTSWILVNLYLAVMEGSYLYIKYYYMVSGNLPYASSLISQLNLTWFLFCNELLFEYLLLFYGDNYDSASPLCVFLLSP